MKARLKTAAFCISKISAVVSICLAEYSETPKTAFAVVADALLFC